MEWDELVDDLSKVIGKRPDLTGILFLIGVQELGVGIRKYSKEEKEKLINLAICKALSLKGYYKEVGVDKIGWPIWEKQKEIARTENQDRLIKESVLKYFSEKNILKED